MAENPLEGLIGGEAEGGPDAPGGGAPDAVAMAVAMDGARYDPELSRKAGAYLDEQQRLVKIQTEHLHEQRAVQITHLRLRVILESFVVAVVAALVIAIGVMVWTATQDHDLVVEAFSVPPDLSQRGITGQVAAKQVLDRLAKLQIETDSSRPAGSYRNNWSDDLKVEIPETGVSLDEVQRLLDRWFGHETHISGEIYHSQAGLTITARAGEAAAEPVSGPDADLDGLIKRAAEAIYRETQPYRYASYLADNGKDAEAKEIFDKLTTDPRPLERAWAYIGLAALQLDRGNISAIARYLNLAAQAEPDMLYLKFVWANYVEIPLGHDENALVLERHLLDNKAAFRAEISPAYRDNLVDLIGGDEAFTTQNSAESLRIRSMADRGAKPANPDLRANEILLHGFLTHDSAEIRQACATLSQEPTHGASCLGLAAFEAHDRASIGLLGVDRTVLAPWGQWASRQFLNFYLLSLAKAEFGDLAGAKALIFSTPADCYECVVGRGQILALAGDRVGAESWFADAIRQGPNIPLAFTARGESRLIWGDLAGALADCRAATKLSPNDPDALKLWGDALARQGQWKGAREKYDAGLTLAPNWVDLQKARAAAAKA